MNFFDTVRDALRTKHYAYRTEKTYMHWIKQYVCFIKPTHPREAGADGVRRFLTHLAVLNAPLLLNHEFYRPFMGKGV